MRIGLAPMEGVLDPLMRKHITRASSVDFCSTEFVRVTDKALPSHTFYKYAPELSNASKTESGTPVLVQLLGGKPEWMAINAELALSFGAYGIDINFGCPAKTVNKHDGGAALLKKPSRLYDTIKTIRDRIGDKAHLSAKVRLGFDNKNNILDISKACSDAGATWLTVHARTKDESYKPPAHWHCIKAMKEVSRIPVYANGDIWNLDAYNRCKQESACNDVMIGRGLVRNPFLADYIRSSKDEKQNVSNLKTLELIKDYLLEARFVYGELVAMNRIKQWLKICSYPENVFFIDIFENFKRLSDVQDGLTILNKYLLQEEA